MDADRLARIDVLLDRQDILDCLTRFSRGMDRFDRAIFLSAFHPDAVIAAGDFVGGREDLYDWASAMHEQGQVAQSEGVHGRALWTARLRRAGAARGAVSETDSPSRTTGRCRWR